MEPQKNYDPNTRYGRRKIRKLAKKDNENFIPDEGKKFLQTKQGCMIIFIVGIITIGVLAYFLIGLDGMRRILKFL